MKWHSCPESYYYLPPISAFKAFHFYLPQERLLGPTQNITALWPEPIYCRSPPIVLYIYVRIFFMSPDFNDKQNAILPEYVLLLTAFFFYLISSFHWVAFYSSKEDWFIFITMYTGLLEPLVKEFKAQPLSSFRCEGPSSMREAKGKMKLHSLLPDFPFLRIERHRMAFAAPDSGTIMP